MPDSLHTSGDRGALDHALQDRRDIHGDHEDHDGDAGNGERGDELLGRGCRRFGQAEQYRAQANAFNASVLDGVPYGCTLEFSRGNQRFIDMIYEAAGPRPG